MEHLKELIKDLELETKDIYSTEEAFEILENAFSLLYGEAKAYTPEDAAALADAVKGGLSYENLEDCLINMIKEFSLYCDNLEENGATGLIEIYSSFDEFPNGRPWWIVTTYNRYNKYVG